MSIIDGQLLVWDSNETFDGTPSSSIPLAEAGVVPGAGEAMEFVIQCEVALAGTFNIDINVVTASAENLTTNQVIQHIVADGITALAAGTVLKGVFHLNVADADASHIGLDVIVNSGSVTAGRCSAWLQRAGENQFTIND